MKCKGFVVTVEFGLTTSLIKGEERFLSSKASKFAHMSFYSEITVINLQLLTFN
jgi:hypothetical protein